MLEDRNLLIHIYDEKEFDMINKKLKIYLSTVIDLNKVIKKIISGD